MTFFSFKKYGVLFVLTLLAILVASTSVLLMGQAIRSLINEGISVQTPADFNGHVLSLWTLVLLMSGASFSRLTTTSTLGERLMMDIKSRLFEHVHSFDLAFFEQNRTGDLLTRLSKDTSDLQTYITTILPLALRNTVLLMGALVMLFMTSLTLSIFALCLIPLVLIPLLFLGNRLKSLSKRVQDNQSTLASFTEESFASIETAKLFAHKQLTCESHLRLLKDTYAITQERNFARAVLVLLVITLVFSGVCFILWFGGHAVLAKTLSSGELTSFIFYAVIVAGTANSLSESAGDYYQARAALRRLEDLLHLQPSLKPGNAKTPQEALALSLHQVTFGYTSKQPILRAISLEIKPGEKIALVGPSGAGKSTLFKLLLRFYDPLSGTLLLGGTNLKDLDDQSLRQAISSVPQTPYIFATTVEENLRYANPHADKEDIVAAAKAADAHDFISALPNGYQTVLGERGANLSGGQRQRLALARVLLRNPQILLLDEATNALDAESEHRIDETLKNVFKHKTVLTIAHRLSTVRDADRIVLLDQGEIVAIGTHEQLLRASELYKRLADLQFIHSIP